MILIISIMMYMKILSIFKKFFSNLRTKSKKECDILEVSILNKIYCFQTGNPMIKQNLSIQLSSFYVCAVE